VPNFQREPVHVKEKTPLENKQAEYQKRTTTPLHGTRARLSSDLEKEKELQESGGSEKIKKRSSHGRGT
jgi:hypothetical protein